MFAGNRVLLELGTSAEATGSVLADKRGVTLAFSLVGPVDCDARADVYHRLDRLHSPGLCSVIRNE
jgi:hypothetical protein